MMPTMPKSTSEQCANSKGSEPTFSHGPWSVNAEHKHPWVIEGVGFPPVGMVEICTSSYRPNAHLIASAPDLYESVKNCADALTYALGVIPRNDPLIRKVQATRDAARAALAKARGEYRLTT